MKLTKPERTKHEQVSMTFRVDADVAEAFERACAKTDITVSEGLRQLMLAYLNFSSRKPK